VAEQILQVHGVPGRAGGGRAMSEPTKFVRVELLAKHSSGKDHVAMTGGTLGADKRSPVPGRCGCSTTSSR
jgi:hypothetical protein